MKKFIRQNLVLIMGISLPMLLVLLFLLTSVLPKSLGTPPKYELLFSVVSYDYHTATARDFEFIVREGVLKVRTGKADSQNPTRHTRKLFIFNASNEAVREIPIDQVRISDLPEQTEAELEETQGLTIDPSNRSPDGYSFEGPTYHGGGLMSELFFGGYRNQGYRVVKGKSAYRIPNYHSGAYFPGNLQFIGWVIDEQPGS